MDETFAEVYEQYVADIYRFALRLTANIQDAEDITIETFIRAYHSWSQLLQPERVRPWLLRITYHLCIDAMRKQRRTNTISLSDETVEETTQLLAGLESRIPLPSTHAIQQELANLLQDILLQLSPLHRAVIVLGDLQGLPNREIASSLQRSVVAVKSLRQRARRALRDEVLRTLQRRGVTIESLFQD